MAFLLFGDGKEEERRPSSTTATVMAARSSSSATMVLVSLRRRRSGAPPPGRRWWRSGAPPPRRRRWWWSGLAVAVGRRSSSLVVAARRRSGVSSLEDRAAEGAEASAVPLKVARRAVPRVHLPDAARPQGWAGVALVAAAEDGALLSIVAGRRRPSCQLWMAPGALFGLASGRRRRRWRRRRTVLH
jgi:hypothetical protein